MSNNTSSPWTHEWTPSSKEDWERSEKYGNKFLIEPDPVLDRIVQNSKDKGLPDIAVSAAQGKFLHLTALTGGAKRILEVGALGGYSAVWMARALPEDGKLITLEKNETHAAVSEENIAYAGLQSKAKVVLGDAHDTLAALPDEPKFDLAFIDADKQSMATYVKEAKRLLRKGGVIVVDNVVRRGRVSDPEAHDGASEGVREALKLLQGDQEISATQIVTVGEKGFDGFIYAVRKQAL